MSATILESYQTTKQEIRQSIEETIKLIAENINKEIQSITLKINTSMQNIVKDIDKLPLSTQDKIVVEMDKIAFKGMTQKTIDKLTKLREFLTKQPKAKLLFGKKTLKKVKWIEQLEKSTNQ